jgi:carbonic anhydrase
MKSTALQARNAQYVAQFDKGELAATPSLRIAIVTCMDARLDPAKALGLAEGEAHVIRNAGGVVTDDVIRSLSVSQHHLGTEEVMVIHHTRCGMQTFTDEEFAAQLKSETGQQPRWSAQAFTHLESDVRESVHRIRDSPFIPRTDNVRGFVYEVETGAVREVAE